jgi:hypothetical protein
MGGRIRMPTPQIRIVGIIPDNGLGAGIDFQLSGDLFQMPTNGIV